MFVRISLLNMAVIATYPRGANKSKSSHDCFKSGCRNRKEL